MQDLSIEQFKFLLLSTNNQNSDNILFKCQTSGWYYFGYYLGLQFIIHNDTQTGAPVSNWKNKSTFFLDNFSMCCYYVKQYQLANDIITFILETDNSLSEGDRNRLYYNQQFSTSHLLVSKIVSDITEPIKTGFVMIQDNEIKTNLVESKITESDSSASIFRCNNDHVKSLDQAIRGRSIRVEPRCFWDNPTNLVKNISKYTQNGETWQSIIIDDYGSKNLKPDLYLTFQGDCQNSSEVLRCKTILLQSEPFLNPDYHKKDEYLYSHSFVNHPAYMTWHLNRTYTELRGSNFSSLKSKILSSIVSSNYTMTGHKKRIDFIKFCQTRNPILFDVFGYSNVHQLSNYLGSLPSGNKDDGLVPYKYTFNAENNFYNNYFTEKIIDAILTETLCFYWGCPNLETYLDSQCFIRLDLDQPDKAYQLIIKTIEDNEWEKRLPIIRKEKQKILQHYHPFAYVDNVGVFSVFLF